MNALCYCLGGGMEKHYLVTGGHGFIGHAIVKALLEKKTELQFLITFGVIGLKSLALGQQIATL